MIKCKPVKVKKAAFFFCRWVMAIIVIVSLVLKLKWLLFLALAIFLLSALLGVRRAPLVMLYNLTIEKIFPSKIEILDENAMRFAHSFGATVTIIALIFIYFINEQIGWWIVVLLSIAKVSGAMGFCGAVKLYGCVSKGGCCAFLPNKQQ